MRLKRKRLAQKLFGCMEPIEHKMNAGAAKRLLEASRTTEHGKIRGTRGTITAEENRKHQLSFKIDSSKIKQPGIQPLPMYHMSPIMAMAAGRGEARFQRHEMSNKFGKCLD